MCLCVGRVGRVGRAGRVCRSLRTAARCANLLRAIRSATAHTDLRAAEFPVSSLSSSSLSFGSTLGPRARMACINICYTYARQLSVQQLALCLPALWHESNSTLQRIRSRCSAERSQCARSRRCFARRSQYANLSLSDEGEPSRFGRCVLGLCFAPTRTHTTHTHTHRRCVDVATQSVMLPRSLRLGRHHSADGGCSGRVCVRRSVLEDCCAACARRCCRRRHRRSRSRRDLPLARRRPSAAVCAADDANRSMARARAFD